MTGTAKIGGIVHRITPKTFSATTVLLLAACGGIWNAGDLHQWVEKQAIREGCEPGSIELDDWYSETREGNIWRGVCRDANSAEQIKLAISVDKVWTPSQSSLKAQ